MHRVMTLWRVGIGLVVISLCLACRSPDKGAGKIGPIKKWGAFAGDRIQSTPTVASDGSIYVGSADKYLYAFTPKGHIDWRYKNEGKVLSPTVAADGSIVYTTTAGELVVLAKDGKLHWKKMPRKSISGCPPAITSNGIIFSSGGLVIISYQLKDGKRYKLGKKLPPATTCVTVGPGDLIYFGAKETLHVYGLDGKERWSFKAPHPFKQPSFDSQGNVFLGFGADGEGGILSLDQNGKQRWIYNAPKLSTKDLRKEDAKWWGFVFPPAFGPDGSLIATRLGEGIFSLSADGKKRNWLYPHPHPEKYAFHGKLVVSKTGMVYAGAADHRFYAITADGKLHYSFQTRGRLFYGPALSPDQKTVYIGSEDKHFYAFHAKKR